MSDADYASIDGSRRNTLALNGDQKYKLFFQTLEILRSLGITAIWALALVVSCYFIFTAPVQAAPGKETTITNVVSFVSTIKMSVWVAWGATAVLLHNNRRLRQKLQTIEADCKEQIEKEREVSKLEVERLQEITAAASSDSSSESVMPTHEETSE